MVSYLADRGIDIRLVTFHGYFHDDGMLLARQVRVADDPRTSSANPPRAPDLNRKATEHGVTEIWQDARESLDYSVRTYYTKSGITCLQRTTTLPDDVRVRGSHSVTIDEPGKIRVTFDPATVDLCHEEFEQLKDAIPFEAEKPPNAPATRRAPNQWYCRWERGEKRAAMAVAAAVAAPSCSLLGSARGEVDRVTRRWAGRGGRPYWLRPNSTSPMSYQSIARWAIPYRSGLRSTKATSIEPRMS